MKDPFTNARDELIDMFAAWDFTDSFPVSYTGSKTPLIMGEWPLDNVDNLLQTVHGQMTEPVISIVLRPSKDEPTTIGNNMWVGGELVKAQRIQMKFQVSCWANKQLGGADMAQSLAGEVVACTMVNQVSLPTFRYLTTLGSGTAFETTSGVWVYDIFIEGESLYAYRP